MGCYLCAYQRTNVPKTVAPLPPGSVAQPNDDLGTCWKCRVWACPAHGSRYGRFECAICTPAVATKRALTKAAPTADDGTQAAAETARLVGMAASGDQRSDVRAALERVAEDQWLMRPGAEAEYAAAVRDRPNLVADLAGAIRGSADERLELVPERRDDHASRIALEAVAGAARDELPEPVEITDEAVVVVTGALLIAMSVADEPDAPERGGPEQVPAPGLVVRPPWQVSQPVLLDPLMWLIATAYHLT